MFYILSTTQTKSMINTELEIIPEVCIMRARVAIIPGRSNFWFILIAVFHVMLILKIQRKRF